MTPELSKYAMSRQTNFADLDYSHKKRRAHREVFLSQMEKVMPGPVLLVHIDSHGPRNGRRDRQPMALGNMFRIYCIRNGSTCLTGRWKMLCTRSKACAALWDSVGYRYLPDETMMLNFRLISQIIPFGKVAAQFGQKPEGKYQNYNRIDSLLIFLMSSPLEGEAVY